MPTTCRVVLLGLFLACTMGYASAADTRISDADHILKPLVGSTVVAEGLAWGEGTKGLGQHLLLPEGVRLYLGGPGYDRRHPDGRLVRVVGKLTVRHMTAAPRGPAGEAAQGYGSDFDYYWIEVAKIEVVDRVTQGFPVAKK